MNKFSEYFTPKRSLKQYNDLLDAVSKDESMERFHYYVQGGSVNTLEYIVDLHTPGKLVDPYDDGYEILSGYCPKCGLEQENPSDKHCVDCGKMLSWER